MKSALQIKYIIIIIIINSNVLSRKWHNYRIVNNYCSNVNKTFIQIYLVFNLKTSFIFMKLFFLKRFIWTFI